MCIVATVCIIGADTNLNNLNKRIRYLDRFILYDFIRYLIILYLLIPRSPNCRIRIRIVLFGLITDPGDLR